MASQSDIGRVISVLCAAYPTFGQGKTPAEMRLTVQVYERLLEDVPTEQLEMAAKQHIASSKWFPTVAELRQTATALSLPCGRTALEAWGEVLAAFTDGRYYKFEDGHSIDPVFTDPIQCQVVRSMGGFWHMWLSCRDSDGNPAADRARFLEAYEAIGRRQRDESLMLPAAREMRQQLTGAAAVAQLVGRVADSRRMGNEGG